ncbi:hypothetical protein ACA910_015632 [Epithemia clementina (nom. ined.)]
MEAIVGFGAQTAARALRAVAGMIDPSKDEQMFGNLVTAMAVGGDVVPESVVAKKDIISIDNNSISVTSAIEVTNPETKVETCLSPSKRKNVQSPISVPSCKKVFSRQR